MNANETNSYHSNAFVDWHRSLVPLTRAQKEKIVADTAEKLQAARIAILADYRGLSVGKIQTIRRSLKSAGASFGVAKKTLLKLACKKADFDTAPLETLKEALALSVSASEDVQVAKAITKAGKENKELKILGAYFEGRFIDAKAFAELAKLPSRQELLARLAATLAAPLSGFARVLNGPLTGFTTIINKLATK